MISISISVPLCVCPSVLLPVCPALARALLLSLPLLLPSFLPIHPCVRPSVHPSIHLSIHPSRSTSHHSRTQLPRAPMLRRFQHFEFEMCFAPQRVQFLISHAAPHLLLWRVYFSRSFHLFAYFDLLSTYSLSLSLFSACFHKASVHIVGSLTSDLLSNSNSITAMTKIAIIKIDYNRREQFNDSNITQQ